MATGLSDKNLKSVIADIPKKGFRTKFWREYRAGACKGSGVGKIMDDLERMGLPASGDPSKANLDEMPNIVQSFSMLSNAMLKAGSKCGMLQSQSKEFCVAYRKVIAKLEATATKLAQNADKIREKEMAQKMAIEKENEQTDQHLNKLKKENEERKKLVRKELAALEERGKKIVGACQIIAKDLSKAKSEFATVRKAFKSQHDKEGVNNDELEAKIDTAYRSVYKTRHIEVHGKNIQTSLSKLLNEVKGLYSQYFNDPDLKKERMSAGKMLKLAQSSFVSAQDEHRMIEAQYKQLLSEVQMARAEGN